MRSVGLRFALGALLSSLLLPGCPAAENVLLLEVRSQTDVDTLGVDVIDGMGRRVGELNVSVDRTRDEINNEEPIRLVVPVGAGGPVTVFVRGRSPSGAGGVSLLATRCYVVSGAVRDDLLLVQVDDTLDADGDGFPLQASVTCRDLGDDGTAVACDIGQCPDATAADCDDGDPDRFPGNDTICMNGIDENCFDDGLPAGDEPCADRDMDGWTSCGADAVPGTCDCADDDDTRNPDIAETDSGMLCNNMTDEDCDGRDTLCDLDGDGYPANVLTGGAPDCNDDPDEGGAAVNPGVDEVCGDGIDNNCNRLFDEGVDCAPDDLDRDNFDRCPSTGTPDCTTCDCNDCNGAIHPGAAEICDGLDQITGAAIAPTGDLFPDCPGDADGDGQVAPRDCNEADPLTYTGAPEDCMSPEVEGCVASGVCAETDGDGDGYVDGEDCDLPGDARNATFNPAAAEACDDVDNDCDGFVNELPASAGNVGCMFDPAACGSATTACRVDFLAAEGNINHCGGCALNCNPGTTTVANACLGGTCDCTDEPGLGACAVGEDCCAGAAPGCADLQSDHDNCGTCGNACGAPTSANPECVAGDCICPAAGDVCSGATPNCCGSGCVDLTNDPNNCGRCGHVCGAGATCGGGVCSCVSADTADCNGDINDPGVLVADGCESAINLPTRCGSCTNSCMTAQVASATCGGSPGARTCNITCTAGFADCSGGSANGCETNIWTDSSCGTGCAGRIDCDGLPQVTDGNCSSGTCTIGSCDSGYLDCSGGAANGCETNIWSDNSCGTACGGRIDCDGLPQVTDGNCAAGTCAIGSCDAGYLDCSGGAANGCETNIWANNSCGTGCSGRVDCTTRPGTTGPGTCASGTCSITCASGFGDCGGGTADGCETNLFTDSSCGLSCAGRIDCNALPGVTDGNCSSGACTIVTCDPGAGDCSGGAANGCETNLWSDGACGNSCAGRIDCDALPGVTDGNCSSGTCTIGGCDPGFADCGGGAANGCETDIWENTSCGTGCAGRVNCTTLPNVGTVGCPAGSCTISSCAAGWGNCSGGAADGCETNLGLPTSCGSACPGTNCEALPHVATASCSAGSCGITTCDAGWDNCDGMVSNGCETDLTSPMDCRQCDFVCGMAEMCCPSGSPRCRSSC